jgi:hypothetical protein
MAIDLQRFIELRPYLYHVTARENRSLLAREMILEPAAELMRRAGRPDLFRWRRPDPVILRIDGDQVILKDQRPLIEANLSLDGSWALEDFVEYLNQHVFFWPGRSDGPILHGVRLLARYDASAPLVLRVSTRDVIDANSGCEPLFCPYNSGAPRQQGGRRARRGPHLFASAERFQRRESEVVELAYRSRVALPDSAEEQSGTGWRQLRSPGA